MYKGRKALGVFTEALHNEDEKEQSKIVRPTSMYKRLMGYSRVTRPRAWPLQRHPTRTSGKHKIFDIKKNCHVKFYIPNLFTFPHLHPLLLHSEGLASQLPTRRGVHLPTYSLINYGQIDVSMKTKTNTVSHSKRAETVSRR
jgi:hypothetical protein